MESKICNTLYVDRSHEGDNVSHFIFISIVCCCYGN